MFRFRAGLAGGFTHTLGRPVKDTVARTAVSRSAITWRARPAQVDRRRFADMGSGCPVTTVLQRLYQGVHLLMRTHCVVASAPTLSLRPYPICHWERSVAISSPWQRPFADVCSTSSRYPLVLSLSKDASNDRLRWVRVSVHPYPICHCERSVAISSPWQRPFADVCSTHRDIRSS